jgi:peptide/nickel transport system permease protein
LRMAVPLALLATIALAAVIVPVFMDYDPVDVRTSDRLLAPGATTQSGEPALLGTDQLGRDMLAQVIEGARISLVVGVVTLAIAGTLGCVIGVSAGYFGGRLDQLLMRLADIQLAFPSILLAILIAAVLGPSLTNVIITLAVTRWVVFARVSRATTLATKEREYVDATRNLGASHWQLIRRCILPACVSPVLVVATVELGLVIVAEASLSFLGLGTPAPTPSWGATIAEGRNYLAEGWWIATMPGLALALVVLSVGVLGDELRDRTDPHMAAVLRGRVPGGRDE